MLVRKTPPAAPLVSIADLKVHLRVDFDDDNALITSLFDAAMSHLDGPRGVLGRCIQPQTWTWTIDCLTTAVRLPIPFVSEVSVKIVDSGAAVEVARRSCGIWTEVAPVEPVRLAVALDITAGTPEDAWPAIAAAAKLLVGHWYSNRDAVVTGAAATALPLAVERLLSPLKVAWI